VKAAAASAIADVRVGVLDAIAKIRTTWDLHAWVWFGALAIALLAPLAVTDAVRRSDMASAAFVILAAIGLNFAVGIAGLPVLAQGAFVAVGAFGVALLTSKAGWDPTFALACAVALAGLAGLLVGAATIRLPPVFVGVATWLFTWMAALTLAAFPFLSGGTQGIVVRPGTLGLHRQGAAIRLTPAVAYEMGVILVALALLVFVALRDGPWGLGLAAARQEPRVATSLGIRTERLRWGAVVISAGLGGLAGGFGVQAAGVADASSYGPLFSVELFVAVILGGAGTVWGPVAGSIVLLIIPGLAHAIGNAINISPARFEPVIAAALLLAALLAGRASVLPEGLLRWAANRFERVRRRRQDSSRWPADDGVAIAPLTDWPVELEAWRPAVTTGHVLTVRGLRKRYGGVRALDDLSLDVGPGEVHAVIGPNGSGKTTLLRAVTGAIPLDAGAVVLRGTDISHQVPHERVRTGVARTLQSVTVVPELTVIEHVLVGTTVRRRYAGTVRTVTSTPLYRREGGVVAEEAAALLALVGLRGSASRKPAELSAAERRLLQLASACASFPSVLLLDEPSAGMSRFDASHLATVIERIAARGVGVVLVEHNVGLVRMAANRVTVMVAGAALATGTAAEVTANPDVIEAYLGMAAP
jgi:branched-chain amino acid transport system permease protein